VTKGWQPFLDAKAQGKIADSFKRFSDTHLSRHAAELKTAFAQPLGDQYADQLPRLTRNIDSMLMLADTTTKMSHQNGSLLGRAYVAPLRPTNILKLNTSATRRSRWNRSGCTAENDNQGRGRDA
jgi:inorganic triphosphatase YgiF